MRTVLLISLFQLLGLAAFSQQLQGKLVDRKGSPVAGATIHVFNSPIGTVSGTDGAFLIKGLPAGHYQLSISSIGFASKTAEVDLPRNGILEVVLESESVSLDEVVVSAQKKEEAMQKTAVTVSALSARKIREYRIWQANEISAIVPNLYSGNSGDDRNVTSIRGITTTSYDPAVATYIDGVNQFGLDTYIANLFDVERIEVLRGPQGTLYGRNAMGGVINIITRQPGNNTSGFAEINIGNYNQQRYVAGVRTPLVTEKLYLGVAGVYQSRDGYYTNDLTSSSYDKQNSFTGNYYLKYLPAPNWMISLNVKHHNNRNNGAFPLVADLQGAFADPFHLAQNATAKMIDNTLNSSLTVQHSGAKVLFSSQTAYQHNHRYYNAPLDGDFSPIDGITIINDYGSDWNKVKVFTQEFKFSSAPASRSPFKWTTGLYLFHQNNPVKQATHFGEDAELVGAPDKNFTVINTNKGKSVGGAVFGQADYEFQPKWKLIAGLRVDYERKKYTVSGDYQQDPNPPFNIVPDTNASVHYTAVSPKLGLSYQLEKNSLAYLTYSRGFRAGGLTQLGLDPGQPPLFSYKPEYSNNLEAGLKNTFWQNRLQLNIAVFYTRVNDVQVPTLVLPEAITITKNAGKLNSAGAELEISSTPVRNLQVDYNFGYTHATYHELKISSNGSVADLSGNRQIFTPVTTSSLAVQYAIPFGKNGQNRILVRGEWMNIGKQYFDLGNQISQNDYHLVNTRAGVSFRHLDILFWGRNLLDKKYIAYAYDFGAVHLGNPLTWGFTVSTRW